MLDGDRVAPVANLYVISPVTQFGTTSHGHECFNLPGIALLVFEGGNGLALHVPTGEGLVGLRLFGCFLGSPQALARGIALGAELLGALPHALGALGDSLFELL